MHYLKRNSNDKSGRQAAPFRRRRTDALVDELADKYGRQATAVLPILQGVADAGQPINDCRLGAIADATNVCDARVVGVQSFYSMLSDESLSDDDAPGTPVRLCDGPACMAHGAADLFAAAHREFGNDTQWNLQRSSCLGLCDRAPAALIGKKACGPMQSRLLSSLHVNRGEPTLKYRQPLVGERRIAMARMTSIDAASYEDARNAGAYFALEQALKGAPGDVIREVERSELRGCGGAGFPTAKKWQIVAESSTDDRYVVCNADESEPGAFKDRALMEGDPHLVIEGMALAAYAVGARQGVIYVRGEYENSAQILERAIEQATEAGWIGRCNSRAGVNFEISVHRGAGAYVCGEETALLESLEGRRGEPRLRPPYPTTHGLFGRPTVVNNVETLCMVPPIVRNGADWFRSAGTPGNPGSKVFSISGHVRRAAAFEAPLGITANSILHQFGLGMRSGSAFKMALTGGAAGTLIPKALLDVPLTYDSSQRGVALGSGVLMFFDTSVSAVDLLEWLLRFFRRESCGKCTPCREGVRMAHEIVRRIAAGDGQKGDISQLQRLAGLLQATSLCGLGKSIELPINSALRHFREDFERCGAT